MPGLGTGLVPEQTAGQHRRLLTALHHPAVPGQLEAEHVDAAGLVELQAAHLRAGVVAAGMVPGADDEVAVASGFGAAPAQQAAVVLQGRRQAAVVLPGDRQHRCARGRIGLGRRQPAAPAGIEARVLHHLPVPGQGVAEQLLGQGRRGPGLAREVAPHAMPVGNVAKPTRVGAVARAHHRPAQVVVRAQSAVGHVAARDRRGRGHDGAQRRVPGAQGDPLVQPAVRAAVGAHLAVAPGLRLQPVEHGHEVGCFVGRRCEAAFGVAGAPAVHGDEDEAFVGEAHAVGIAPVGPIGRHLEDHGQRPSLAARLEDHGGQVNAADRGHRLAEQDVDVRPRRRGWVVAAFDHGFTRSCLPWGASLPVAASSASARRQYGLR